MDSNTFLIYGAAALIGMAVQLLIIRYAVRADEIVSNQKAATWLLIKMVEKQGVAQEDIDQIMQIYKIK